MLVNNVVYGDTTFPLQLTFSFCAMQIKPHSELTQVEKKIDFKCHSHYEQSSRKQVFFHFLPTKRVEDTCLKNSLVVLHFSFFASPQAKKWFLARPPVWTAIESANFTDFVQCAETPLI